MFRKPFPVFVRGLIDDSLCVQFKIETGHSRIQLKKLYQLIYLVRSVRHVYFIKIRSVSSKQEVLRYGIWHGCLPSEGSPYLMSFRAPICMLFFSPLKSTLKNASTFNVTNIALIKFTTSPHVSSPQPPVLYY
jgi:hypothetical protein